jgi:hypothetical protein
MKTERNQEVRVKVDLSLTLSTKHGSFAVKQIVQSGIRRMFPHYPKVYHEARFAEEGAIYSHGAAIIPWKYLNGPAQISLPRTKSGQTNGWTAIPHLELGRVPERLPDENPALYRRIIAKRAILAAYEESESPEQCITDLLADLRHLCDGLDLELGKLDGEAYRDYAREKSAMSV